jgi:hypothetical protein
MSMMSMMRRVDPCVASQSLPPRVRGARRLLAGSARRAAIACALAIAAIGGGAAAASGDPAQAPAAAPSQAATMSPVAPGTPSLELPRLDDRRRVALPPMVIPQDPPGPDRRPVYIGAGLIVLGAAFWWNRRQRDRFEREDGRGPPARAAAVRRRDRDDDADDLHAAARGDAPEPPRESPRAGAPEPNDPPGTRGPS